MFNKEKGIASVVVNRDILKNHLTSFVNLIQGISSAQTHGKLEELKKELISYVVDKDVDIIFKSLGIENGIIERKPNENIREYRLRKLTEQEKIRGRCMTMDGVKIIEIPDDKFFEEEKPAVIAKVPFKGEKIVPHSMTEEEIKNRKKQVIAKKILAKKNKIKNDGFDSDGYMLNAETISKNIKTVHDWYNKKKKSKKIEGDKDANYPRRSK